jgi:hypothetical protein
MEQREAGIVELKGRLETQVAALGLKALKRNPTSPIVENQIPGVFIHEGDDDIAKRSNGNWAGYPATRRVKLHFELFTFEKADIKGLLKQVRNILFSDRLVSGCTILETGTFGPANNGVPGILYMQLIISLTYTDQGPTI